MKHCGQHQRQFGSLNYFLVLTLCLNNVCDYVRQGTVVTYRACKYKGHMVLNAFIHHSPSQDSFFNQCLKSSSFENLVDGLHMVAGSSDCKCAVVHTHAKRSTK